MATFNDLPVELVQNIVNLTVEDLQSHLQAYERRFILIKLCLISRIFKLPAQDALWSRIDRYICSSDKLIKSIQDGFGRNKKVESFTFVIPYDSNSSAEKNLEKLEILLLGVDSIEDMTLTLSEKDVDIELGLSLFTMTSLQHLKSLKARAVILSKHELEIPASLKQINWDANDTKSLSSLFRVLEISSTSIDTLCLEIYCDGVVDYPLFQPSAVSYFSSHGAHLRTLHLRHFDSSFMASIFPFLTTIETLSINVVEDFDDIVIGLKELSISSLLSLEVGQIHTNDETIISDFLIPLVNIEHLNSLITLRILSGNIDGLRYHYISDPSRSGIDLESRDIMDRCVEICRRKGIQLWFINREQEELLGLG